MLSEQEKMSFLFDPRNRGFIIMAIVGLMLLFLAVITATAPGLIGDEKGRKQPTIRISLVGFFLSIFGVGEVPILFLLGIYPFMIGTVGWGTNLLWYRYFGTYPTTPLGWWIVHLSGFFVARIFIWVAGKLRWLLRTHTVADALIPERFIGKKGNVLAILNNEMLEVSVDDEVAKCQVQIYCFPWENAVDKTFHVGDQVYIVDLIAPRRYSVVKFDSEDELRAIATYQPTSAKLFPSNHDYN